MEVSSGACNRWAQCQTYRPASFLPAFSSPREEVGLVGQEGEVPRGRCSGGATPLAGISGAGCEAVISNSTAEPRLSRGPIPASRPLSSTRIFPFQFLLNTCHVHSIYLHRGKGGKGCEGGPHLAHFPLHRFLALWSQASGFPSRSLRSSSIR